MHDDVWQFMRYIHTLLTTAEGGPLLRHRFEKSLIDGGAYDAAVMRQPGHSSSLSLGVYHETEEKRLRECALGISGFPIRKEVLA